MSPQRRAIEGVSWQRWSRVRSTGATPHHHLGLAGHQPADHRPHTHHYHLVPERSGTTGDQPLDHHLRPGVRRRGTLSIMRVSVFRVGQISNRQTPPLVTA